MRLYVNQETLEKTADYAVAQEWVEDEVGVSIYEKIGEMS